MSIIKNIIDIKINMPEIKIGDIIMDIGIMIIG
jgi:hypothetical protein